MKRKLLTLGLIFVLVALMIPTIALAEEELQTTSVIFGGRLQSDTLFYLQAGVFVDTWDVMASLGLNNSIWLGAHKYINPSGSVMVFTGVELHVEYPADSTIKFEPALPIGFAISTGEAVFVIESLILPSLEGDPVKVTFAVSFLFRL